MESSWECFSAKGAVCALCRMGKGEADDRQYYRSSVAPAPLCPWVGKIKMSRIRRIRWCFTLNDPNDEFKLLPGNDIRFAIWQKERRGEGTLYVRGYIAFTKKKSLSTLRNIIEGVICEECCGTEGQCIVRCSREAFRVSGPWEFGKRQETGARNDLSKKREENGAKLLMMLGVEETKLYDVLEDENVCALRDRVHDWGSRGQKRKFKRLYQKGESRG